MAMEEDSPRPFLVLGDIVQDYAYIDREAFRKVKCLRQEAYDCGENGDDILRGLALFVRLGRDDDPDKSPKLCISASDEVFDRVGSEIDDDKVELYGKHLSFAARICSVDGYVMVIRISFVASFSSADFRSYFLVYDSAAASLFLIPTRHRSCRPICTMTPPLKVGEGPYSLVLMAEVSDKVSREPVLGLWTPRHPKNFIVGSTIHSWVLKGCVGVNAFPDPFQANVVFLFKGNAVWGDLAQGILYCHCSDVISVGRSKDFKHIMLPRECRISMEDEVLDHCSLRVHRTMGCVGDSIWFVIIEPNFTCPGETTVKVWTLNLLRGEGKWSSHREFKMLELFRAQGHVRHPETVPKFPMVRQQADCALHMLLPEPYKGGQAYGHLVSIDLCSRNEVRLQSNRRLATPLMNNPVFLDPDFFNPRCPLINNPVIPDPDFFTRRRLVA